MTPPRKRLGIIQSNYIPWKGYFDFISLCDEFVLLEDVQYTRRDWRNRNIIKSANGALWLTIPIDAKGKYEQLINETAIADPCWHDRHLSAIRHSYGKAPHFKQYFPRIEELYQLVAGEVLLTRVNELLIRGLCELLGISTPIIRSDNFETPPDRNLRLVEICVSRGATEYLSGPAAKAYLDTESFECRGISVSFKSYEGYREYEQLHPPFSHGVSILDMILHLGPEARNYLHSVPAIET